MSRPRHCGFEPCFYDTDDTEPCPCDCSVCGPRTRRMAEDGDDEATTYVLQREVNEAKARIASLEARGLQMIDCGQEVVCALPPGCMRHWSERNGELVAERDAARARVAELETERKRYGGEHRTDCPDCGEGVAIDEDGCCVTCGRDTDAYCGVIGSLVTRAGREHAECISAGAIMERDAAIAALRALVDALPTCDAHAPRHCTASVVPWADALTAALAVLEKKP